MTSLTFSLQALLARHEAYVVDSEQDRKLMLAKMEELEQEKRRLEHKNKETVDENRKLLDQLEALNFATTASDAQVQSLTDHLHATEARLERVNALANRAESVQRQLSRLEEEQMRLHSNLDVTKENERAAVLRWQQAERTIVSLHLQIEHLEREAKKERDRQQEESAIIQRKAALEAQLQAPADGSTSSKTLLQAKRGNNAISHFVKDILQDNANLQLGMVELRELLQTSHEEVEHLRGLVAQHVPLEDPNSGRATPTLGSELGMGTKEFHVHHHYHAPSLAAESSKTPKNQIHRRPRKSRVRVSSGQFTPVSALPTPRSSISILKPSSPTSTAAILSPTSVSIPRQKARWSMQSNQTGFTSSSSLPSSPSGNSIFDRVFNDAATATDISRPSSPESAMGLSPRGSNYFDQFSRMKGKKSLSQGRSSMNETVSSTLEDVTINTPQSSITLKSQQSPPIVDTKRHSNLSTIDIASPMHSTIPEEAEDILQPKGAATLDADHPDSPTSPSESSPAPALKRVASHESIFSISGMDIHTIPDRPSQRLIGSRIVSAPVVGSSFINPTAVTATTATAVRPSLYRSPAPGSDSFSRSYLSDVAGARVAQPSLKKKPSMGQTMGSWLYGRWMGTSIAEEPLSSAATATPASGSAPPGVDARSVSSGVRSTISVHSGDNAKAQAPVWRPRPPGVNQVGPIFGFGPEPATPFKATLNVGELNEEALRECLTEIA